MILVYGNLACGEYSCILAFDNNEQADRFFELQEMTKRDDVADGKRMEITTEEFEKECAGKGDWYNMFFKGK